MLSIIELKMSWIVSSLGYMFSLGTEEAFIKVEDAIGEGFNFSHEVIIRFDFISSSSGEDTSSDNLTFSVWSGVETWVVDGVASTAVSCGKNPMASIVDIQNDNLSWVNSWLDLSVVWGLTLIAETEGWNSGPDEEISTGKSSVTLEPFV